MFAAFFVVGTFVFTAVVEKRSLGLGFLTAAIVAAAAWVLTLCLTFRAAERRRQKEIRNRERLRLTRQESVGAGEPPREIEVSGAGSPMADGTYVLTTTEREARRCMRGTVESGGCFVCDLGQRTGWSSMVRTERCTAAVPAADAAVQRGVRWETGTDGARPVPAFTAVLRNAGLTLGDGGLREARAKDRAVATAVLSTLLGASAALSVQKETGVLLAAAPSGERCKLGINLYALGRVSDTGRHTRTLSPRSPLPLQVQQFLVSLIGLVYLFFAANTMASFGDYGSDGALSAVEASVGQAHSPPRLCTRCSSRSP